MSMFVICWVSPMIVPYNAHSYSLVSFLVTTPLAATKENEAIVERVRGYRRATNSISMSLVFIFIFFQFECPRYVCAHHETRQLLFEEHSQRWLIWMMLIYATVCAILFHHLTNFMLRNAVDMEIYTQNDPNISSLIVTRKWGDIADLIEYGIPLNIPVNRRVAILKEDNNSRQYETVLKFIGFTKFQEILESDDFAWQNMGYEKSRQFTQALLKISECFPEKKAFLETVFAEKKQVCDLITHIENGITKISIPKIYSLWIKNKDNCLKLNIEVLANFLEQFRTCQVDKNEYLFDIFVDICKDSQLLKRNEEKEEKIESIMPFHLLWDVLETLAPISDTWTVENLQNSLIDDPAFPKILIVLKQFYKYKPEATKQFLKDSGLHWKMDDYNYVIKNPLVVLLAIGDYKNKAPLNGATREYINMITTFGIHMGYSILLRTNSPRKTLRMLNNEYWKDVSKTGKSQNFFMNDMLDKKNDKMYKYIKRIMTEKDFKINWQGNEIQDFIEDSKIYFRN